MKASVLPEPAAAPWNLILGYGRKRRGLKWATLMLALLFVVLPLTWGVKQYRSAMGLFDLLEAHLNSYDGILRRASVEGQPALSAAIERLRLTQKYAEISSVGVLDEQMRVVEIARPAETSGAFSGNGADAVAILGTEVAKAAMKARDRAGAVMTARPGPLGVVVLKPIYRNGQMPASLNARRAMVTGWSFLAFRPDELIDQAAPDTRHTALEVFDGGVLIDATDEKRTAGGQGSAIGLAFQRNVNVFGRTWLIRQQRRTFIAESSGSPATLAAISGLAVAILGWTLYAIRRRSFELGRRMLDVLVDVIAVVDADGKIAYASASVTKGFGYQPEELIGQPFLEYIHPDDQPALAGALARVGAADGDAHIRRRRALAKDGAWRYVEATMRSIRGRSKPIGTLVIMHDVTDILLLEEQVERAARVESLGRVAAQVAHEFNNVLMSIQTNLFVLERRHPDDASVRASTSRMLRSVTRGQTIAKDILRFGRPVELNHRPIDVEEWFRHLEEELRPLLPDTVALEVDVAEPVVVVGDAHQLSQVIVNLVLNARDAIRGDGHVVCAVERSEGGRFPFGVVPAGQFAHVEVRDDGVGVPQSVIERMFEPLFTTKAHGTGLGLAISHQIVMAHQGLIFAESEEGEGTDVHIFLPAQPAFTEDA